MSNQVGCTPSSSIGELSYTYSSICIRCMTITTPYIVSIIRLPLVWWSLIAFWDFFPLAFQTPINVLLAITSWCQYQMLTLTDWVDFETVHSWRSCLFLLDWILLCCENLLDAWYSRIELLHWILKTPLMNLVRFHVFKEIIHENF